MNRMEMAKSLIRKEVLRELSKSKASDYQEGINSFKQADPELQKRNKQKAYQASKESQKVKHTEDKIKAKTNKLNKRENRKQTVGKLLQRGKQAITKIPSAVKAGAGKVKEHFKDPEETSKLIPKFNMPGASPLKRLNLVQSQKQNKQEPVAKSAPIAKSGPIVHNVTILSNGPYLKP